MRGMRWMLAAVAVCAALATAAGVVEPSGRTSSASSLPTTFELVFDGKHNDALLHEGPFTTSSSLCPSGFAADVSINEASLTAMRGFTCAGAAGEFTAQVGSLPAEHGGSGAWQIVAGSGPLQDLRGKGTFTSVRTGGDAADPPSITFRSTWKGVVALDAAPPVVAVSGSSARRLRRARRFAVLLRLNLALRDDAGGSASYTLTVTDRAAARLASTSGRATGTSARALSLLIRPAPVRGRVLQLKIAAEDAVGNRTSFTRTVVVR